MHSCDNCLAHHCEEPVLCTDITPTVARLLGQLPQVPFKASEASTLAGIEPVALAGELLHTLTYVLPVPLLKYKQDHYQLVLRPEEALAELHRHRLLVHWAEPERYEVDEADFFKEYDEGTELEVWEIPEQEEEEEDPEWRTVTLYTHKKKKNSVVLFFGEEEYDGLGALDLRLVHHAAGRGAVCEHGQELYRWRLKQTQYERDREEKKARNELEMARILQDTVAKCAEAWKPVAPEQQAALAKEEAAPTEEEEAGEEEPAPTEEQARVQRSTRSTPMPAPEQQQAWGSSTCTPLLLGELGDPPSAVSKLRFRVQMEILGCMLQAGLEWSSMPKPLLDSLLRCDLPGAPSARFIEHSQEYNVLPWAAAPLDQRCCFNGRLFVEGSRLQLRVTADRLDRLIAAPLRLAGRCYELLLCQKSSGHKEEAKVVGEVGVLKFWAYEGPGLDTVRAREVLHWHFPEQGAVLCCAVLCCAVLCCAV
eukprot:TRINITY_DN2498_c0_g5_i1.p1 TRINITY_DN2498_c0_g5~~TRINITY_DN2498_c0_g5_i1.p1  ORF type:complete len:479 (+),score=211.92 TRINITY_DN2498_c0_g5_i1:573-2009(+)